mmetsp:Transcript_57611/g.89680  ORF Transcript_57611/g.89680 Transcript_57611/m.89680 type:complete len:595 (+) Transcript_57611:88-1872(+)
MKRVPSPTMRTSAVGRHAEEDAATEMDTFIAGQPQADNDKSHGKSTILPFATKPRMFAVLVPLFIVAMVFLAISYFPGSDSNDATDGLRLASWNIAAINNNPFEYWITHEDPIYASLMHDVQAFIDAPAGDASTESAVKSVFEPSMLLELQEHMVNAGFDKENVDAAVSEFQKEYMERTIINGFLRDGLIGKKRLVSMPDRMTNTINLANGKRAWRPAVDNCYPQTFESLAEWWKQWKDFMFQHELDLPNGKRKACDLVTPISRKKYPQVTEAEETMSKPLSTIMLAAFDSITVHMLATLASGKYASSWQTLRGEMCNALNSKKSERTLEILTNQHKDADVIFLQEVAESFAASLKQSPLASKFTVHVAPGDGKRDQLSVMLLSKQRFLEATVKEHTKEVEAILSGSGTDVPVAPGDILTLTVKDRKQRSYVLASFHGDTNGLATIPVVRAMSQFASSSAMSKHQLVFGLDANTHEKGDAHKQDVTEFGEFYTSVGLSSCWGDRPDPKNYTTFNARTYLQPQLNKAVSSADLGKPGVGDKNPKDFILFRKDAYTVLRTWKDNTGLGKYVEDMVFPTLRFPSDHGLIATQLRPTR